MSPSDPMRQRCLGPAGSPGLRAIFATILLVLSGIATGTACATMVVTTAVRRATSELVTSLESVSLAERLRTDLLEYSRASNRFLMTHAEAFRIERDRHEAALARDLADARRHVDGVEEAELLDAMERKAFVYLTQRRSAEDRGLAPTQVMDEADPALDEAFAVFETFSDVSAAQAHAAQQDTARWNQRANVAGVVSAAAILTGSVAVLIGLRLHVIRPLLALCDVIQRFGRGIRGARVVEVGPAELRGIARAFNGMAEALAHRREAQLAFLGGVAHDLRNPLSALRMSVAVLAPDHPLPPEPRMRRILELVRRQIDRLERMLGDLLDTSRIEAGKLDLRLEDRDLRDFGREVVELYRAVSSRHEITLSVPEEPVLVRCDPTRIEQVLNNLVSNAIKYSPDGGRVDVAVFCEVERAVISVRDEGPGIAADEQERIFEPFRRASSHGDAIPGTGLGLAIARRIAEAHAGRLLVESCAGEGALFRLEMPIRSASA